MPEALKKEAPAVSIKVTMKYLVRALIKYNASDMHLKVGRPPLFRIHGKLVAAQMSEIDISKIEELLESVLSSKERAQLETDRQIDFSFKFDGYGRFRCQAYYQRGTLAAAIRMIPLNIPSLEDLGIPSVAKELCNRPRGLLLVTGPTGSGKSTTLASLVQHINESRHVHIIAIEDPIEFVFRDLKSSIIQRQIGSDCLNFQKALESALRQDPDILMLGELRTPDVIQTALTAAETGHLVMATLHTHDTKSAIERILDAFPPEQQAQARVQLASVLVGVISQQLISNSSSSGRTLASEMMVRSPKIESHILKNELDKIHTVIENSTDYYQMQTMDQSLERLVKAGKIKKETALQCSQNPDDLRLRLSEMAHDEGFDFSSSQS